MKRRRHALVEVSSDDESSSDDDFAPTKLKSKRVSIVLNKKQRATPELKCQKKEGPKQSETELKCKRTEGPKQSETELKCKRTGSPKQPETELKIQRTEGQKHPETTELRISNSSVRTQSRKHRSNKPVIEIKIKTGEVNGKPNGEVASGEANVHHDNVTVPFSAAGPTKPVLELSDLDDSLLLAPATSNLSEPPSICCGVTDVSDIIQANVHESPNGVHIELSMNGSPDKSSKLSESPSHYQDENEPFHHSSLSSSSPILEYTENIDKSSKLTVTNGQKIKNNATESHVVHRNISPDTFPATTAVKPGLSSHKDAPSKTRPDLFANKTQSADSSSVASKNKKSSTITSSNSSKAPSKTNTSSTSNRLPCPLTTRSASNKTAATSFVIISPTSNKTAATSSVITSPTLNKTAATLSVNTSPTSNKTAATLSVITSPTSNKTAAALSVITSPTSNKTAATSSVITSPTSNDSSKKQLASCSRSPSTRNSSDTLGYSFCQICQKNITSYSPEKRRTHVNRCCDVLEKANNFGSSEAVNSAESLDKVTPSNSTLSTARENKPSKDSNRPVCPLCEKSYANIKSRKRHLKQCCEKNKKCFKTVLESLESPPALLLQNEGAVSRAQNRILDVVANQLQDTSDIPATPALKTSNLTTYRSKRNSIWNLAGNSSTTSHPTVLSHDNSLINTQNITPLQPDRQSDGPDDLSSTAQDVSICLDRSALPSQADITQLTQFLTELGRDNSMKERLSTLIQSPPKVKSERNSSSSDGGQRQAGDRGQCQAGDRGQCQAGADDKSHVSNFLELEFQTKREYQLPNIRSSQKSSETMPVSEITVDQEPEFVIPEVGGAVEVVSCKTEDRSPNPSEISAVGNSSVVVQTPVCNISEIVSPTHEEDSPLRASHLHSSGNDDSNLDLFADETERRVGEFDRSLLNVSPITDHGLAEEGEQSLVLTGGDNASGVGADKGQDVRLTASINSSSIYQPKVCSSTTRDVDVSAIIPCFSKSIQASCKTRCKGSEAVVSTRCSTTNTPVVEFCTRGTHTEPTLKSSTDTQADGDRSLCSMMLRLKDHTSSCNVTVLCTDNQQRQAHRIILEVACPNLLADLVEVSSEKTLEVGLSGTATDLFLEFLYTHRIGKDCIDSEILKELYSVADRYSMTELTRHLHEKVIETVEIKLKRELGGTLLLNLSTQEVISLSEQLVSATQQLPSADNHTSIIQGDNEMGDGEHDELLVADLNEDQGNGRFSPDFPSFQEHSFINNWSLSEKVEDSNSSDAAPGSSILVTPGISNSTTNPPSETRNSRRSENTADDASLLITGKESSVIYIRGQSPAENSDPDDLPSTGLLAESEYNEITEVSSRREHFVSEADKRASQLIQDVEFLDLVNSLDDIVVSTPLSLLDRLDQPTNVDTSHFRHHSTPSRTREIKNEPINISNFSSLSESTTPEPTRKKAAPKRLGSRKSSRNKPILEVMTPDQSAADLSTYQKTPAFKEMDTPRLKSEVQKFGMKPLTKKKAVAKLEEIHRFTNKKFLKCPEDTDVDNDVVIPRKNKKTENALRINRITNSKKRKISDDDSSSEKECPVGDITIHGKMQKNALVDVSRMIKEIITATEELYCKILQYEPIDILLIKGLLKRKTSVALIAQVLDDQGITYFNSETKAKGFGRRGNKGKKSKT